MYAQNPGNSVMLSGGTIAGSKVKPVPMMCVPMSAVQNLPGYKTVRATLPENVRYEPVYSRMQSPNWQQQGIRRTSRKDDDDDDDDDDDKKKDAVAGVPAQPGGQPGGDRVIPAPTRPARQRNEAEAAAEVGAPETAADAAAEVDASAPAPAPVPEIVPEQPVNEVGQELRNEVEQNGANGLMNDLTNFANNVGLPQGVLADAFKYISQEKFDKAALALTNGLTELAETAAPYAFAAGMGGLAMAAPGLAGSLAAVARGAAVGIPTYYGTQAYYQGVDNILPGNFSDVFVTDPTQQQLLDDTIANQRALNAEAASYSLLDYASAIPYEQIVQTAQTALGTAAQPLILTGEVVGQISDAARTLASELPRELYQTVVPETPNPYGPENLSEKQRKILEAQENHERAKAQIQTKRAATTARNTAAGRAVFANIDPNRYRTKPTGGL